MSFCRVKGCLRPTTHTTAAHRCEKCNTYGHGKNECGNQLKILNLTKYKNDKLLEINFCSMINCKHFWSHSTEQHQCHKCGYNHSSINCAINTFEWIKNRFPIIDILNLTEYFNDNNDCYVYFKVDLTKSIIKMGDVYAYTFPQNTDVQNSNLRHCFFIRKKNDNLNVLWINKNLANINDIRNDFIKDLDDKTNQLSIIINSRLNKNETSKCPYCRATINKKNSFKIKALTEKCSVCLENNVEIYFPECEHACICSECLKHI